MTKRITMTPERREALTVIRDLANEACTGASPEFMAEYQRYFDIVSKMLKR